MEIKACPVETTEEEQTPPCRLFGRGLMCYHGHGCSQSDKEAVRWFTLASDKGHESAPRYLGDIYSAGGKDVKQSFEKAAEYYAKGARHGDPKSMLELGTMYEDGRGVSKDAREAARYYLMAAEKGYAPAQLAYGALLESGKGVEEIDLEKALQYFKLAAEQGCENSQHQVFRVPAQLEHRLGPPSPLRRRSNSLTSALM